MSNRPWHKRFHGDAITGYMGLSLEERGAYSTLLDYLYDRRAPLPENMRLLAGYLDVSVRKAEAVIQGLIQKGKLYRREDGTISNRRFDQELENDVRSADHMAEIGSRGGRKSSESKKKHSENNVGGKRAVKPRSSNPEPELKLDPERKKKEQDPPPSAPGRAVKASIPDDFPHIEAKAAAVLFWKNKGRPDLAATVDDQAAQFRDHHAARGGKMLDWAAAWRTWVRNALEFTRAPRVDARLQGAPAATHVPTTVEGWVSCLELFHLGDEVGCVDKGYWRSELGPQPGSPGCMVPADALRAYAAKHPPRRATG
jgi:uncharacterized protein YdaU (DUF1376 family)